MKHHHLPAALLLAGTAALATNTAMAGIDPFADPYPHPYANTHIVIQVDRNDPTTEAIVLHNTANILQFYGPKQVEIEVVAYGPGLKLLLARDHHAAAIHRLTEQGVMFAACENTMHAMHVTRAQLNPDAHPVPSGAVAIVKREQDGWKYLRP